MVTVPVVVIRPIELLLLLVNHNAQSGPVVIPDGFEMRVPVKFVIVPAVVTRPIELLLKFVNHNAPSGPAVMLFGFEMVGSVK